MKRQPDGSLLALGFFGNDGAAQLLESTDSGRTWTVTSAVSGLPARGVSQVVGLSDARLIALPLDTPGNSATTPGYISDDGGKTWTSWTPDLPSGGPQSLHFVSATDGWARYTEFPVRCASDHTVTCASSALYATKDGGATWDGLSMGATAGP
jgi:photosystem II stability/assembly factor-like uncharacterized protein